MLDRLLQDTMTTPTPRNGRLEALGAQRVVAVYLDEIQISGATDVPVSARADVAIGDTARIELSSTDGLLLLDNQQIFQSRQYTRCPVARHRLEPR